MPVGEKRIKWEVIEIMKKSTVGVVVAGVAIACFMAGGALSERLMRPEIIEVPVEAEVVKWREPEREFIYLTSEPVSETAEVLVEVPFELRNF